MATNEELRKRQGEVSEKLNELLSMNIRQAALKSNLGDINFESALPVVNRIIGLFEMLRNASLDFVAHKRLNELYDTISQVINHFKQIEAFSLSVDNPKAQRDSIVSNLQNSYDTWFERVYPLIAFTIRSSTDFAALERDLRTKIAQAEVTSKELLDKQTEAATQAQETLESIKKAAAEAGVSREAVHFKKEADDHESGSIFWFRATVVMAIATAVWGIVVLWWLQIPTNATVPQIINQALGKLIILSGLYFGLVWCARNYRASKHNFIVNRHRQNALSTFETFVKAAGSEDIKQAVLLQATTSIFSAQPSGYAGKDSEAEQPGKVIEILRSFGSPQKSSGQ